MTHRKKTWRVGIVLSLFGTICACSAIERRQKSDGEENASGDSRVSEELSLKEDRSYLTDLRQEVPEETRHDNDELAAVLKDMASPDKDQEPSRIRERFNREVRKRRDTKDKQLRREREAFNKDEREKREQFLKTMRDERDDFNAARREKDERKRFFDRQDSLRREFFADQSEARKEFESGMTQRRRDFEDYVRERTNRFNQELRDYTKLYYDRKKNEGVKARAAEKERRLQRDAELRSRPTPVPGSDAALQEELARPPSGRVTPLQADEQ